MHEYLELTELTPEMCVVGSYVSSQNGVWNKEKFSFNLENNRVEFSGDAGLIATIQDALEQYSRYYLSDIGSLAHLKNMCSNNVLTLDRV